MAVIGVGLRSPRVSYSMNHVKFPIFTLTLALGMPLLQAQTVIKPLIPSGTGVQRVTDPTLGTIDAAWSINENTLAGEPTPNIAQGAAATIVLKNGNGWLAPTSGAWISAAADQSNIGTTQTRPGGCCIGETAYALEFGPV